jgi:hypothetical protein
VVAVIRLFACCFLVCVACLGPSALAADLPLLQSSDYDPARDAVPNASGSEVADIVLTLPLPSFFATADGPRMEGSDSLISEMVVPKTGKMPLPEMRVTLSGHVIKTADSLARIDIQIGAAKRSFTWGSGEVKSGRFELTFNEPVPGGKLPKAFPVSAIALVTKEQRAAVVMVSLDSITLTLASARVAEGSLQPESTALWPDLAP